MTFFAPPPLTPYDLHFTLLGIPVRVHPLFWLMAILFGASSASIPKIIVWVIVIFISILIHELGHSLAMRVYGQDSYIVLYLLGGLAVFKSTRWNGRGGSAILTRFQEIEIALAGPLAGFFLAALIIALVTILNGSVSVNWLFGFIPLPEARFANGGSLINSLLQMALWVNVFWGYINLIPVYPLDGGQVARNLFLQANPVDGLANSLWLSVVSGALMAIIGVFFLGSTYMGLLFGILAFQSYQALQGQNTRFF